MLDTKLKMIIHELIYEGAKYSSVDDPEYFEKKALEEIKLALIKDGWLKTPIKMPINNKHIKGVYYLVLKPDNFLSGEEWYNQFCEEIQLAANTGFSIGNTDGDLISRLIDNAARKAAGLV